MTYKILFSKDADRTLQKLDRSVSLRLLRKLKWLGENAEQITGEGLRSDLSGTMKLREGDYRVIYQLRREEGVIELISIGHRSEIYK